MVKRFFHDAWGEALETGKAMAKQARQISPAKMTKTAVEQVSGLSSSSDVSPGLEDLKAKKKTPQQLQQMKQEDNLKKRQEIDSTRTSLKTMIIRRYKEIQAKIKQKEEQREKKEEEKKKQEEQEKQQKEQQEQQQKSEIALPKGKKARGTLGMFRKQKRGSAESKLGKPG